MVFTKEFDISILEKIHAERGSVNICLVGPSGLGKTSTVELLIERMRSFSKPIELIFAINKTKMGDADLCRIVPSDCTFTLSNTPKKKELEIMLNENVKKIENLIDQMNQKREDSPHSLIITDDLGAINNVLNSSVRTNRHKKISLIIIIHSLKDLEPTMRNSGEFIFVIKDSKVFLDRNIASGVFKDVDLRSIEEAKAFLAKNNSGPPVNSIVVVHEELFTLVMEEQLKDAKRSMPVFEFVSHMNRRIRNELIRTLTSIKDSGKCPEDRS